MGLRGGGLFTITVAFSTVFWNCWNGKYVIAFTSLSHSLSFPSPSLPWLFIFLSLLPWSWIWQMTQQSVSRTDSWVSLSVNFHHKLSNWCHSVHVDSLLPIVGGWIYNCVWKMTTPILCQTTPLDWGCFHEFPDEKINCKSSEIDLAAIETHF